MLDTKHLFYRRAKAKNRRKQTQSLYQEAYQYAIPNRDMYTEYSLGAKKNVQIYDSTAVISTRKFVDKVHTTITPPEMEFLSFVAGDEIPKQLHQQVNVALNAATETFFKLLGRTNFHSEANSMYYDLAVAQGALLVQFYDEKVPATFTAVPSALIFTEKAEDGLLKNVFRDFNIPVSHLQDHWPEVRLSYDLMKMLRDTPLCEVKIAEMSVYNPKTDLFEYRVFHDADQHELFNDTESTSPWIMPRWSVVPGEHDGRGPLLDAMPDIKTLNKAVEMVLQNAAISIAGVYTAADDGVLNPDIVEIAPGVIIPVATNGGSNGRSLDVLPRSGDFTVAELTLDMLKKSIRAQLFDTDSPLDDTVRSAEEVRFRKQKDFYNMTPVFGRLKVEYIDQLAARLVDRWAFTGDMPNMKVDGKMIKVNHVSPLMQVQNDEDLASLDAAIARTNQLQAGLAAIAFNLGETASYISDKQGIPVRLRRTPAEIEQTMGQMGAAAGQNPELLNSMPMPGA